MKFTQEQIEAANSLNIQVVAEKLKLPIKRQGKIVYTHCLWHADGDTPNLQLGGRDAFKSQCHCYVCNKSWNVVSLVMESEKCSFQDAMQFLCKEFGIEGVEKVKSGKERYRMVEKGPPPNPQSSKPSTQSPKPKSLIYGTVDELRPRVSLQNALAKCLLYRFPMDVVARVTFDYYLGVDYDVCHYDHTLFPSIDWHQRVHHVKAQGYVTAPSSPQFGHSTKGDTYWVGQKLMEGKDVDTDCLFGEHLLPRYLDRPVVLVESPKNAVVGACQYPNLLWLATGNKGMLKRPLLEALRGRQVIVMPDRDAAEEWAAKIATMQDIATFQMSSFCDCNTEADNKKMDIADLIL